MTKFNVHLTTKPSSVTGLEACRRAATMGEIKRFVLSVTAREATARVGVWRRVPMERFVMEAEANPSIGALQVEGFIVEPREPLLEELTRHAQTAQAFIPCNGPLVVAVAPSLPSDEDQPDPSAVEILPCEPGEGIIIEKGIWHTLPFTFSFPVKTLTVVHRLPVGIYHDVRDLPAQGWFGEIVGS